MTRDLGGTAQRATETDPDVLDSLTTTITGVG
jgi:hypothetical protein